MLRYLHILLLVVSPHTYADTFPRFTIPSMCDMADAIVEGENSDGDKVSIHRVYKRSEHLAADMKELIVVDLGKHNRQLWNGRTLRIAGPTLETKKLLLFLSYSAATKSWSALHTIESHGVTGSCGVLWHDGTQSWQYIQTMNPGPYGLVPSDSVEVIRSKIEKGLTDSQAWRAVRALENPDEKAVALCKYLLERTSPTGTDWTFLFHVREPLGALGDTAVQPLIDVLKTARPEDKLDQVVLILYDLGPKAKPAIPFLLKLLDHPNKTHAEYVRAALKSIQKTDSTR